MCEHRPALAVLSAAQNCPHELVERAELDTTPDQDPFFMSRNCSNKPG